MRQYAYLAKPLICSEHAPIVKIMLYESEEGIYLFGYDRPDADQCITDRFYDSLEELHEDWDDLIDEKGWIGIEDPLPGCQHDAFIPLRVKGRDAGKPEWGQYEIFLSGEWVDYRP